MTDAADVEALAGAWRSSTRWTSRLFSPAVAVLSMSVAGQLSALLAPWLGGLQHPAALLAAMLLFAAANALITAQMVAGVPRLKRGEAFFQWADLLRVFRWVGLAYLGSAALAALLFLSVRLSDVAVLLVLMPVLLLLVLLLLVLALHFYFRQQ